MRRGGVSARAHAVTRTPPPPRELLTVCPNAHWARRHTILQSRCQSCCDAARRLTCACRASRARPCSCSGAPLHAAPNTHCPNTAPPRSRAPPPLSLSLSRMLCASASARDGVSQGAQFRTHRPGRRLCIGMLAVSGYVQVQVRRQRVRNSKSRRKQTWPWPNSPWV